MRSGKSFWHAKNYNGEWILKKIEQKTTPLKKTVIVACVLHIICIERGDPHDTGYSNNIWD